MTTFQIRTYLNYWLEAVDRHSLHSPFFFDLYEKVIRGEDATDFTLVEQLRAKLLQNPTPVITEDHGAGSVHGKKERTIRDIARTSLSPAKYSRLYARLIRYQLCRNIIELGTSLGINTLYLASEPKARVTTFEGSPPIASVARSTFEFASAANISLVEGNIDLTLSGWLEQHEKVDLAFIDANHRYAATLKYFHLILRKTHFKSVIIVDDIHYTPEMEKAWTEIKNDPLVYASLDLYRSGFLFFDPSLNKQHVVLQF
jgi:predicted O-methyltransferase YrrM